VNLGSPPRLSGRVLVVGGGNVAMDAARSALRLGPDEVRVVYRRSRTEVPAHDWEVEEAAREGVQFSYLTAPVRVVERDGRASGLECRRMELGEGVFAGGDLVRGPSTAVHAMADGYRAAQAIRRYLEGMPMEAVAPPVKSAVAVGPPPEESEEAQPRVAVPQLTCADRAGCFDEVELGLDMAAAVAEARRCLRCGRERQE
jgi:hypothetical protein